MKIKLLLLLLAFITFSCFDDSEEEPGLLGNGAYAGTFQRVSPVGDYPLSTVELTVEGNAFTGYSETHLYPAMGQGTLQVKGQKVIFQNEGFWTANFDWSLILDKEFSLQKDGEWLVLTRQQGGDIKDVYRLKKKAGDVQ